MNNPINRKIYRIIGLSLAIIILAMSFWLQFRKNHPIVARPNNNFQLDPLSPGFSNGTETENSASSTAVLPLPGQFPFFDYDPTSLGAAKTLSLDIRCQDDYYTILIFSSQDDYRDNPAAARFNQATPCRKGEEVKRELDLGPLNLTAGRYYYIRADQGKSGSWHDAR